MDEPLHPSTLSEILDRTAQIYRARFMVFFGIAVIPTAVLLVFAGMVALLIARLGTGGTASSVVAAVVVSLAMGGLFLLALPTLIGVTALATAAMSHAAARAFMGQPITIRASYLAVWRKGWRYVGLYVFEVVVIWVVPFAAWSVLLLFSTALAALTLGAVEGGALFALSVLGIVAGLVTYGFWMAIRVSLAFPASVVEQAGAWDGLRRSATLTKGSRGRILVLYLLGVALNFILSMAVTVPLLFILALLPGVNSPERDQTIGFVILLVVYGAAFAVQALTRPVYGIALMLFYYDQRIRQEAFDIEWMMLRAGLVAPPAPQPQMETQPAAVSAAAPVAALAPTLESAPEQPAESLTERAPEAGVPGHSEPNHEPANPAFGEPA